VGIDELAMQFCFSFTFGNGCGLLGLADRGADLLYHVSGDPGRGQIHSVNPG